jgi:CelD/BcsL family acetyltransferase involved in cellulose biosynthesis
MTIALSPTPTATSADVTVDVIDDVRGFDRLRSEWQTLLGASTMPTPFLSWSWLRNWWTHLAGTATLQLFVVRERGALIGIAPLMLTHRGVQHSTVLEFLGTRGAGSDYLDAIVRGGCELSVAAALAQAFDARQWPLHLDHLPPSPSVRLVHDALNALGWTAIEGHPDVCPFIPLAGHSWDSYLTTLGASHRANVRRRLRSLAADFDVRFNAVTTDAERRTALAALVAFSTARWADSGGTTAFGSPQLRAFHESATAAAFDDGTLRVYVLTLNGGIAAVLYGFVLSRRFYFYQHGFDPGLAARSIGVALMALTIKAAIDEGNTEFDMLYGHESYKSLWARQQRQLGRIQLFPPRMAGTLLRREVEARQALRSLAYQLGLKRHRGAGRP